MPHPLEEAQAQAATLLTQAAHALGSSASCSLQTVRFRPDGKGGELAAPFPMIAGLDAQALAGAIPADPLFACAAPSGRWIALEVSEQWLEQVRRWTPPERTLTAAVPPVPDFPARILPALWRLDALAGITGPLIAARLDRGNPAWRVRRSLLLTGQDRAGSVPDRRLCNEAALLWALLEQNDAKKLTVQLIALADRYLAAPGEDTLVHRALRAGWTALNL